MNLASPKKVLSPFPPPLTPAQVHASATSLRLVARASSELKQQQQPASPAQSPLRPPPSVAVKLSVSSPGSAIPQARTVSPRGAAGTPPTRPAPSPTQSQTQQQYRPTDASPSVQSSPGKRMPGRTRTPRYTSPTRRLLPHTPGTEQAVEPGTKSSLKALEATRQRLEDEGKYLEAEEVHRQIVELKLVEETRRKEQVRQQHLEELLGVEQAHLDEFKQFNETWDRQMMAFEARTQAAAQEQKLRHDQALADLRREAEQSVEQTISMRTFPHTKHLLEMRKSEKALAKQRDYRQAHAMKEAADAVEQRELEERISRLRLSFHGRLERLKDTQAKEVMVLQQKAALERAELEEGRKQELDALLLRYRNVKSEMESGKARAEVLLDQRIAALSPQVVATKSAASRTSPGNVSG